MSLHRLASFIKTKLDSSIPTDPPTPNDISHTSHGFLSTRRRRSDSPSYYFSSYYAKLPLDYLKNGTKPHRYKPNTTLTSLRQSLVVQCYNNVYPIYFVVDYKLAQYLFTYSRKQIQYRVQTMSEELDEVEVCLFNQISSRFDYILSVLRTVESLDCLVVENIERIVTVRKGCFAGVRKVECKHYRISRLVKRREKMERVREIVNILQLYKDFLRIIEEPNGERSRQYEVIRYMREHGKLFGKLSSAKYWYNKINGFERVLKQGFSETINAAILTYVTKYMPYRSEYWNKYTNRQDIFEEDRNDANSTVILDESVIEEDVPAQQFGSVEERVEESILKSFKEGWEEGEYTVGNLKAMLDKQCKYLHNKYLVDCRNFCFKACQYRGIVIENPSIGNLLQKMSLSFCSKIIQHFCDIFRNLLIRTFSVTAKCVQYSINMTATSPLTIDNMYKLTNLIDGLTNVSAFTFKIVYDRFLETYKLRPVYDSFDLSDLKLLVGVLETYYYYLYKRIRPLTNFIIPTYSFLTPMFLLNRFQLHSITLAKQSTVTLYLYRSHANSLNDYLKRSLYNYIWQPTDIPTYYYDSLHYLITGYSLNLRRNRHSLRSNTSNTVDTSVLMDHIQHYTSYLEQQQSGSTFRIIRNKITVGYHTYQVTYTVLLIVEIIEDYMYLAQYYPELRGQIGLKINELIRSYNSSSMQLIVCGGAVVLGAIRSKNITAKNLALSNLCLAFLRYLLSCVGTRVQVHESAAVTKDLEYHYEIIMSKLSEILLTKVMQLLPDINVTVTPSKGTEAILLNTRNLYDILLGFYERKVLSKIFKKEIIRLYLGKVKTIEVNNRLAAEALRDDISYYFGQLEFLDGVVEGFAGLRIEAEDIVRLGFYSL